jgi:hypothetical protein
MKTKLHPTKRTLFVILGLLICSLMADTSLAETCPRVESIISSNPDSADYAEYLSPEGPGWHSLRIPVLDLIDAKFDSVYADTYEMHCIYDTPNAYLGLSPNNHRYIDINTLRDNSLWYCNAAQSPVYPDRAEEVCICTDSLEACQFSLQAPAAYVY